MIDDGECYDLMEKLGPTLEEFKGRWPKYDPDGNALREIGIQCAYRIHLCDELLKILQKDYFPGLEPTINCVKEVQDEYGDISIGIEAALTLVNQGDIEGALHYAALAGMAYNGTEGETGTLEKMRNNLAVGRVRRAETAKEQGQRTRRDAELMIEKLFTFNSFLNQPGEGWRKSKKEIYAFIRERGIRWSDKHAERVVGSFIDEVKARHFQK